MKLYTVRVGFDYVMAIEDGDDPNKIAMEYIEDAFNDTKNAYLEINTKPYKPHDVEGWDNDCIPYGSDDDKTTGEYLKGNV